MDLCIPVGTANHVCRLQFVLAVASHARVAVTHTPLTATLHVQAPGVNTICVAVTHAPHCHITLPSPWRQHDLHGSDSRPSLPQYYALQAPGVNTINIVLTRYKHRDSTGQTPVLNRANTGTQNYFFYANVVESQGNYCLQLS